MAVAFVQKAHATSDATANSVTANFGVATTAGNTVVGEVSWFNGSGTTSDLSSITDSAGNAYTIIDRNGSTAEVFSASFVGQQTGSANAIKANFTSANPGFFRHFVQEYSGSDGTVNKHATNRQVNPGTGTDAITSTAVITTTNGCMIIGTSLDISSATATNAGTGYTSRDSLTNSTDNDSEIVEDQLQTSAGSIAATFTSPNGATATFYTYLIALNAASGGAGDTLMGQICL